MSFHDVLLPSGFQYASLAGAGFATIERETATGHRFAVGRQAQPRHRLRLVKALQTKAEAKALKSFAIGRRGSLHSFKVQDFSDYTTAADGESAPTTVDQIIGTGDGTTTGPYQLVKLYDVGGPAPYNRVISLPVSGSVVAALNGSTTTAFTVNGQGQLTFTSAPGNGVVITAGCQFYVPVCFAQDFDRWAQLQADAFDRWSLPNLDCIEVLNTVENPQRREPDGSRNWGSTSTHVRLSFNDGCFQHINPTAAINVYLPAPTYVPGGHDVFVISVAPGAGFNVQVRDDAGNAIGSAFGSGGAVRSVDLVRDGSGNVTWVIA